MEGDHPSFATLAALVEELYKGGEGPSTGELAEAFTHTTNPQEGCTRCQAVLFGLRGVYEVYITNS